MGIPEPGGTVQLLGNNFFIEGNQVVRMELLSTETSARAEAKTVMGTMGPYTLQYQATGELYAAGADIIYAMDAEMTTTTFGDLQCETPGS